MTLQLLSRFDPEEMLPEEERPVRVYWEAQGSTDVNGEWHYSGDDEAYIRRGQLKFNKYPYHVQLSRLRGKRYRVYSVRVRLTSQYLDYPVTYERGFRSKRKARERVWEIIREFEATDKFEREVWPKVTHPNNRVHIVRVMKDGSFAHIASAFGTSGFQLLGGRIDLTFGYMEKPFGYGEFWTNQVSHRWDDEHKKHIKSRTWGWVKIDHFGMTGGGRTAPEELVNQFNGPEFTEWVEVEKSDRIEF